MSSGSANIHSVSSTTTRWQCKMDLCSLWCFRRFLFCIMILAALMLLHMIFYHCTSSVWCLHPYLFFGSSLKYLNHLKKQTKTELGFNETRLDASAVPGPILANDTKPLITLFTTFKHHAHKEYIYQNTIRNWALLGPLVVQVLYYVPGEVNMTAFAKAYHWKVLECPKVDKHKVPILSAMYLDALRFPTTFHAYVNGDILFTEDLLDTLKVLSGFKQKLSPGLIVGRRSNFKMKNNRVIETLKEVVAMKGKAKMFGSNAQDYFIVFKNGYPWKSVPSFVVGRPGYDNWLVANTIRHNLVVVDTTRTITCIHQTDADGDFAGFSNNQKEGVYENYKLAGLKYDYALGRTTCSQFQTHYEGEKITIHKNMKNTCAKVYAKYKLNPYLHH